MAPGNNCCWRFGSRSPRPCHEHILRLFRSLDVSTIELAHGQETAEAAPKSEVAAKAEPARRRRPRRVAKPEEAPERIAAEAEPRPPVAPEPAGDEPPALAPPSKNTIAVAEPAAVGADDGLDDSPWEETADDDEDFPADGGAAAA